MRYILAIILSVWVSCALAQAPTRICVQSGNNCVDVSSGAPFPVTASVSVGGFAPGLSFATLTATGSSASVALPTGTSVQFQNTGTTAVSCTLGIGSATATTNEIIIQASSTKVLVVGTNTFGACIDQSGSASNLVVLNGGAGLGTDSGGGSGSDGAVTAISGAFVDGAIATIGTMADAACATDNGTCTVVALQKRTNQNIAASVPPGTNRIGYISDDVCSQKIKLTAPFSTSSAGPVSIVALSGSTVVYICHITAITDTAIKLSFIDGTGGSCASAQHAIWGSTTAANGMSLAANGGFTAGSGNGTVGTTTAASAFCLLQSGTSLVSGTISYVQQ